MSKNKQKVRNPNKIKRNWTHPEVECLRHVYELGATLQSMAFLFNRSGTAINKALERFGIRPSGAARSKISRLRAPKPVNADLIARLISFSRQHSISLGKINPDLFGADLQKEREIQASPGTALSRNKGRADLVLSRVLHKKNADKEFWGDLNFLIGYLERKGCSVRPLNARRLFPSFPEFCFNDEYLTSAQLLVRANEFRRQEGKEPFYINEISIL